jgi:hypothetical protein
VPEESEISHLNDPRVPLHADFRQILQLRNETAQYLRVRGSIQQKQALIIKHPRPASLRG